MVSTRLVLAAVALERAGGRIVSKRAAGYRVLGVLLRAAGLLIAVLSLGKRRGLGRGWDAYITTIGPWVGVPDTWETWSVDERVAILRHETVHVRQFRAAGLGSPVLGILPLAIVYLLVPLPVGLAWGRYRLELAAYVAGFRAQLEEPALGESLEVCRYELIERGVRLLSGPAYGWAWPARRVRAALEARL